MGHGFDFCIQVLLDSIEIIYIIISDERNSDTQVSESSTSPDSVEVSFSEFREVEVDDDVDIGDVDTSGHEVRGDKASAGVVAEVVVDSVSVLLVHLSVDVVAGEAHVGDFLGKQFDSFGGVAENDRLVDFEFLE